MIEPEDDMQELYDTSKYQSAAMSELPDVDKDEDGNSQGDDSNEVNDASYDPDKDIQRRKYKKLL